MEPEIVDVKFELAQFNMCGFLGTATITFDDGSILDKVGLLGGLFEGEYGLSYNGELWDKCPLANRMMEIREAVIREYEKHLAEVQKSEEK